MMSGGAPSGTLTIQDTRAMIPDGWITRLRALAEHTRPPLAAATDRVQPIETLVPGQRVEARVVQPLPGGRYVVEIGGRSTTVALGKGLQTGTFVSLLVDRAGPQLVLRAAPGPAAAGISDAAIQFSAASRLAAALAQAGGAPGIAVTAATPVLEQTPQSAALLAGALQRALAASGLFYESHLAEWASGERALDDVLTEPQARNAASHPGAAPEQHLPAGPADEETAPARAVPTASQPEPARPHFAPMEARLDGNAAALMRGQLHAIETHELAWHGQLFPGQWMEWDIAELPDESGAPGAAPSWRTRVALDLPRLGRVLAVLHLGPAGLGVNLEAEDAGAARELADGAADLRAALAAAGLRTSAIAGPTHAAR